MIQSKTWKVLEGRNVPKSISNLNSLNQSSVLGRRGGYQEPLKHISCSTEAQSKTWSCNRVRKWQSVMRSRGPFYCFWNRYSGIQTWLKSVTAEWFRQSSQPRSISQPYHHDDELCLLSGCEGTALASQGNPGTGSAECVTSSACRGADRRQIHRWYWLGEGNFFASSRRPICSYSVL